MKKLLFIFMVFCCAATASAQMDFQYGFKAGLNFTTYDSDADDFQARAGQLGILCRFKWNNFAIQPEIHYARMGVRSLNKILRDKDPKSETTEGRPVFVRMKLKLLTDNVQMPIIFKYYPELKALKGLNVQAGPTLSQRFNYHVSTSECSSYVLDPQIACKNGDIRAFGRDQNQFTVLWTAGLGYDSSTGIGCDLRFSQGITPVFKGEKQKAFTNCHDRVWSIAFTYVF